MLMSLFMVDLISVSFLCLFVTSGLGALEEPDFIDLSQLDYLVMEREQIFMLLIHTLDNLDIELKCSDCIIMTSLVVNCTENELVKTNIEIRRRYPVWSFPFNMICSPSNVERYTYMIKDMQIRSGITDLWITWKPPNRFIYHYLVIIMDRTGFNTRTTSRETYRLNNLKEKSWHQICIASVNSNWITSRFKCEKGLTDFSTTGPVTNVTITSESDRVFISWSGPEYKYDIPQGFIIYLQGRTNQMCRLYIIKRQSDIDPISQYSCVNTQTINSSLSSLEIEDLSPHSEFGIEISPFNKNKTSAITYSTIKTKEGESGPVQNLKADLDSDPHYIHISFDAPKNPAGIILKYRMRVILKKINICTSNDEVIHEVFTRITNVNISKSVLQKCASYMFEVAPINGYSGYGGIGKNASVPFNNSMDHQSSWTVHAKFISSNSLTVSLGGLNEDKCEILGFIIKIKDEKNHSNCLMRIISSIDCEAFKREIDVPDKCVRIQLIRNSYLSSSIQSFVSGIFRKGNSYLVKTYKIANVVTEMNSLSIQTTKTWACFTDCYIYGENYIGIRSVLRDGRICKNWNDSNYGNKNLKSNICTSVDSFGPWCYGSGDSSWSYCDVPECSSNIPGTGCVKIISKDEYTQNVTVIWFILESPVPIIGFLILLHNSDHFCEQAIIQSCYNCQDSNTLRSQIKSLYLSCKSIEQQVPISFQAAFLDLHQNRNYNVYIVPITTSSSIGEIRNVTVRTRLAKPHIPNGISYKSHTFYEITFFWKQNVETESNGPAEGYFARIRDKNNTSGELKRRLTESVTFYYLTMCSEYCFFLSSYNEAGESSYTKELCTFTLAPKPEIPVMTNIPSGYMRSQYLNWTYSGSDKCRKSYLVEYRVKFLPQHPLFYRTNDTRVLLTGLTPNVIYTVRVRAEGQITTFNNESIGEFSPYKEFYTGTLQPNISYFQHNLDNTNKTLNISWGIKEAMRGSIFMYILKVKNSTQFCMYSILLECQTCREPWTWITVRDIYGDILKKLLDCVISVNGTMDPDQTSFSHRLTFDKELTNFNVDIYGINLMGIHLLNGKDTFTPTKGAIFYVRIILIIIICVSVLLSLYNLKFIKLKRRPLRLICKRTELQEEYSMRRTEDPDPEQSCTNIRNLVVSAFPTYYEEVSRNGSVELIKQFQKLTNEVKTQDDALEPTVLEGVQAPVEKIGLSLNSINASYIPFENDETQMEYIAAQGPIDDSLSDFWEMIWEQNIHCTVMLTSTLEDGKGTSSQYWPNDVEQVDSFGSESHFSVTLMTENNKEAYVERELSLMNTKSQKHRKIVQLHMHTWSDHSVPDLNFFDKTLSRFHEITKTDTRHPYLVHCSTGVGATGTFICIDRIIKQLIGGSREIGIYDTVLKLRKCCNFMVEEQAEYNFIHEFINHFLANDMKVEDIRDDKIDDI